MGTRRPGAGPVRPVAGGAHRRVGAWWRWLVSAGRRDGGTLGPGRYHKVRYEELVAHPEHRLRELALFLELPYAPEMARYFEGKTRSRAGRSAKGAWLPPTSGLREWRAQMSVRDQELFEAIAGDLLSELGYELAREPVRPKVAALAERCEGWWRTEMERRARGKLDILGPGGDCRSGLSLDPPPGGVKAKSPAPPNCGTRGRLPVFPPHCGKAPGKLSLLFSRRPTRGVVDRIRPGPRPVRFGSAGAECEPPTLRTVIGDGQDERWGQECADLVVVGRAVGVATDPATSRDSRL